MCLKVGMILPLQTGRAGRRRSAWTEEWWGAPEASPTVKVGAEGSMLVTGAPRVKWMSLAPESRMAVSEIWAALLHGTGKGAARHL